MEQKQNFYQILWGAIVYIYIYIVIYTGLRSLVALFKYLRPISWNTWNKVGGMPLFSVRFPSVRHHFLSS